MSILSKKSSLKALFIVHFLTCVNDNLYKTLLVFFLIGITPEKKHLALTLTGLLFVIPFIFCADLAGSLSDRCRKTTIIYWTKALEIVAMSLGLLSFIRASTLGGYLVLSLTALLSAIFSPAKFGMLPEICPKEKLSYWNGIMLMITYIGSILGVFLASLVTQLNNGSFVIPGIVCVSIAIIAALLSCFIKKTELHNKKRKIALFAIIEVIKSLRKAKEITFLLPCLCGGAFFFLAVTYTQLNLLPFISEQFGWTEVYAGYLFLIPATSLMFGSWLIGKLSSKNVMIKQIPLMAMGMAVGFFLLWKVGHTFLGLIIALVILGFCAGVYTIPLHAFVQTFSPENKRGRNIAAGNFFDFLGVAGAAGFIFLWGHCLQFSSAAGFGMMALLSFLNSGWCFFMFKNKRLQK